MKKSAWLLLAAGMNAFAQGEVAVSSRVTEVTVFSQRAMITRKAEVDLPAGPSVVVLSPLTADLIDESVRVTGEGTVPFKITDVKIVTRYTSEIQEARRKALQEKLDGLRLKHQEIQDRIAVLETQKAFIESIRVEAPKEINRSLLSASPNLQGWQGLLSFFGKHLAEIYGGLRNQKVELEAVRKEIDAVEKELGGLAVQGAERIKQIQTAVELVRPGHVVLTASYGVGRGASWTPLYEIRVFPESRRCEVGYSGLVRQGTGEPWEAVRLTLSTAQPHVTQVIPHLPAWYVDFVRLVEKRDQMPPSEMVLQEKALSAAPAPQAVPEEVGTEYVGEFQTAVTETRGTATVFTLPALQSLPADDQPHKVFIGLETLEGRFEFVSVPKMVEKVFIRGRLVNQSDKPFLPGEATLFVEGDYVSRTRIPYVAPSDTLSLALGVDERIRVERRLINRFVERAGFLGGRRRITFTYEIRLENHHQTEETVRVMEHFPISRHEKIHVRLLRPDPASVQIDPQNRITWIVPLKPGERKVLPFQFEVEFPEGMEVNL